MIKNKFVILIIIIVVALIGYSFYLKFNQTSGNSVASNIAPVVGNDKDEHGCIGSAGYTWSGVKQACIRLFESGIKMDPKDDSLDKTMSAFVVFKSASEYQIGELFLPGKATPTILTFKKGVWADQDGNFKLFEQNKNLFLLGNGSILLYGTADPK